jgi:phosphate/sulfate permease
MGFILALSSIIITITSPHKIVVIKVIVWAMILVGGIVVVLGILFFGKVMIAEITKGGSTLYARKRVKGTRIIGRYGRGR